MPVPKRIVVATDFSEHSDRALRYALDLAGACDAQVFFVHVVETIQQCVTDYCINESTVRQIEEQSAQVSREKMRKEVESLTRIRRVNITFDVRTGNPAEEILKEQEDKEAELVVVGSHGRSGFIGHITGSVADRVVHHARCPVLLVR
jgi:nucleotide-binding universal stress UspA family protein